MVIIDTVVNTLFGGLTPDPAGMHCPSWDDAFVSSSCCVWFMTTVKYLNELLLLHYWGIKQTQI